MFKQFF